MPLVVADKMMRAREGKMVIWSLPKPRRITKWPKNHLFQEASPVPGLQDPLILHNSPPHQLVKAGLHPALTLPQDSILGQHFAHL